MTMMKKDKESSILTAVQLSAFWIGSAQEETGS
jgi:hypothetical protein